VRISAGGLSLYRGFSWLISRRSAARPSSSTWSIGLWSLIKQSRNHLIAERISLPALKGFVHHQAGHPGPIGGGAEACLRPAPPGRLLPPTFSSWPCPPASGPWREVGGASPGRAAQGVAVNLAVGVEVEGLRTQQRRECARGQGSAGRPAPYLYRLQVSGAAPASRRAPKRASSCSPVRGRLKDGVTLAWR